MYYNSCSAAKQGCHWISLDTCAFLYPLVLFSFEGYILYRPIQQPCRTVGYCTAPHWTTLKILSSIQKISPRSNFSSPMLSCICHFDIYQLLYLLIKMSACCLQVILPRSAQFLQTTRGDKNATFSWVKNKLISPTTYIFWPRSQAQGLDLAWYRYTLRWEDAAFYHHTNMAVWQHFT